MSNVQGTADWHQKRIGKVTASRIIDVMSYIKSGSESADRAAYRVEKVTEILTGNPTESFTTKDMQFGVEYEPEARATYESLRGSFVDEVDFVDHPKIKMAGASPDGLVGEDGLIEVKVPKQTTHIKYLTTKVIPLEYQYQMLWQMACTGRKWCDWISYDPRHTNIGLKILIIRFNRDEKRIQDICAEVIKFNKEVRDLVTQLKGFEV